ncbi:MAG TPA: hypothetical protein PK090_08740 [Smithellaceae bacterium]|nr:hypothetical protein [Smithellaceae bacterium]
MRYYLIAFFLLMAVWAHGAQLPDRVWMKSATQSFTHEYDVAIDDGRIWYKSRKSSEAEPRWKLLGTTGLPASQQKNFSPPSSVKALSADGDNLIAIGDNDVIYYMKWSSRKWTDHWGLPLARKLHLPRDIRSWSISHRGSLAGGYADIDGHFHPIWAGVTTLYVLSKDGLSIQYADPWLKADFAHEICLPLRNRFRARALAASGSTLFVINDAGDMYTRLADFDTLGHNPLIAYSYERKIRSATKDKDKRTLPPEDWKKQPSIPARHGRISPFITIFQTGRGNDARTLRVEGVNRQGVSGFFSKPLQASAWSFTPTGTPLEKALLSADAGAKDAGPDRERSLRGSLRTSEEYAVWVERFNPPCAEARLVVLFGEDRLRLPLFIAATSSQDRKMKGALLLTDKLKAQSDRNPRLRQFIESVFGLKTVVNIRLKLDNKDQVLIHLD